MSSAIHYGISRNDGTQLSRSIKRFNCPDTPGLESLLEADMAVLAEVEHDCNAKISQLEKEAHRIFFRLDWKRGFTSVDYTKDTRIVQLLFHSLLDASKKLPHLNFEFYDSYYYHVHFRINQGQLIALPEVEIANTTWIWEDLQPFEQKFHLVKAMGQFNYLCSLDPMLDADAHTPSTRVTDFYYHILDVTINPSFAFDGEGSRFLSVHYMNPCDIAKNGRDNFANLGEEAFAVIRPGLRQVREYLDNQPLDDIGMAENVETIVDGMQQALDEFKRLLEGKAEPKAPGLHKYRLEFQIAYIPKYETDLHKVIFNYPEFTGERIYAATCESGESDVKIEQNPSFAGLDEIASRFICEVKEKLSKQPHLEWFDVTLALYQHNTQH